ncbi:hypothetical protein WJX77_001911 [Trebouxia sp. C0004]
MQVDLLTCAEVRIPRILQSFLNWLSGTKPATSLLCAEHYPLSAGIVKSFSCVWFKVPSLQTAAKGIIGWRLDLYSACLIVLQSSLTLQASPHQGE